MQLQILQLLQWSEKRSKNRDVEFVIASSEKQLSIQCYWQQSSQRSKEQNETECQLGVELSSILDSQVDRVLILDFVHSKIRL
mmetsp:Transcript_18384/g.38582  ORF Transcript_18384/g.38582 Transcript_18384/m.38582 type:complete len:83 (-) Transcript_18384:160-408(-)